MTKLWGGRFSKKEMDPAVMAFTSSLEVDRVLAKHDCVSTKAHVEMLAERGYMTEKEKKEIIAALDAVMSDIDKGRFAPGEYEDVHSAIQDMVLKKTPYASKMHTGRSRNEQVVNDVRLYCREEGAKVLSSIRKFQSSLLDLAEKADDTIVPGYTHMNRAQPVLFSHLVMAYVEMLGRDASRMKDALGRSDVSVMGSGAIAGSSLELDRKMIAEKLGFGRISENSIDAVSDRDFMTELVSVCCITMIHLSRISEDLILYSIPEFGFIRIGDDFCTGSSLMPQKRNPDVLELVRGRSAKVIGDLNALMVLQKGLPHSYNRDLQEDKAPLFGSLATVRGSLAIMAELVNTIELDPERSEDALQDEGLYATDLAEYLVRGGMAFSEAHEIVGRVVRHAYDQGCCISDIPLPELKGFSDKFAEDVLGLLDPRVSVENKKTPGSTNPEMVKRQISDWRRKLGDKDA